MMVAEPAPARTRRQPVLPRGTPQGPRAPSLAIPRNSCPANADNDLRDRSADRRDRRDLRYRLRESQWDYSTIRRLQWCGKLPAVVSGGARATPEIRLSPEEGVAYYAGVGRCGSVWACPVCSPKIRQERALEVEAAMQRWIAQGGTVVFVTLTMPHDFGEPLADLMGTISAAYSSMLSGRSYREDRERFGIAHWFRTWDATHGKNGWHPHLHAALFVNGQPPSEQLEALGDSLYERFARAVESRGHRRPTRRHGLRLEEARHVEQVAGYLLKVKGAETGATLAMELTRGDLKRGRGAGHRTPFEILEDFETTGDLSDRHLFNDWEQATKGRHFTQWSVGARKALLVEELSDEEILETEVGGVVVYRLGAEDWIALTRAPGALATALRVAETGTASDVARYVAAVRAKWRDQRQAKWRHRRQAAA